MFKFTLKNRNCKSINSVKHPNIQCKYNNNLNNVKNNKINNFVYSSKRVSFTVKSRKDYWNDIRNKFVLNKNIINYYILQKINNYVNNDSDSDLYETFINQPVSPVLALTLILLNKGLFGSQTLNDYLDNDKHQVYAYTHWNGNSFSNNSDKLYIDNPFSENTEEYKQILPGYNNINVMNFYKGCYL